MCAWIKRSTATGSKLAGRLIATGSAVYVCLDQEDTF
jgi:hypothetical protein